MRTASVNPTPSMPLADWPGLNQVLRVPPSRANSYAALLESATHIPQHALPSEVEGDVTSGWFRSGSTVPQRQAATEFLRMSPGAWLAFGEYRFDEPQYVWSSERQQRAFCIVLRGGCVFGFAPSPRQCFALTEGHALGIAYGSDTLVCRTPLPGVHSQVVSVYFDNDEAMHRFGLDVEETNAWLSSASRNEAAPGLRIVASMPNVATRKAAQAIFSAPYHGARRRLFLRSKATEMLCHLMASPEVAVTVPGERSSAVSDDASLAALAYEFVSDPEHCPDVVDVAARLKVSARRLLSAFRVTYGISLRDHISGRRMALARRLLMQTNTPLLEVTFACGYEHHSSFSTAYRRNFGETPIETRRAALLSKQPNGAAAEEQRLSGSIA